MRLSAAIMAHESRAEWVSLLVERLDRDCEVIWDRGKGVWDTGSRAMAAYDPTATHHLCLQDDSIISPTLIGGLEAALKYAPETPVSAYLGRVRPLHGLMAAHAAHADATGVSWVRAPGPLWGVAIVMPTSMIADMLAWCEKRSIPNYDRRITDWCKLNHLTCMFTYPSLVDHRTGHGSLLSGPKAADRRAHRFIGVDRSPFDVDWSKTPTPPEDGLLHSRVGGRRLYCYGCTWSTTSEASARRHVRRCPELRALVSAGSVG